MTPEDFKARTRAFAIAVIREVRKLPATPVCRAIASQLVRSACGTASNYRAACRGRSTLEFVSKLGVVLEEADESAFWLDMLIESEEKVPETAIRRLHDEAEEIVAMTVASIRTAARNLKPVHPARRGGANSPFRS